MYHHITGTLGVVIAVAGVAPSESHAAQYGGFGSSYSEVINPKDAVLNDETKNTDEVKAGREGLQNLIGTVNTIKKDLVMIRVSH